LYLINFWYSGGVDASVRRPAKTTPPPAAGGRRPSLFYEQHRNSGICGTQLPECHPAASGELKQVSDIFPTLRHVRTLPLHGSAVSAGKTS
ncbi:MAG: hypothetical protein MK110_07785, partial [Fuerstiella sp.]|nr:hypothetical protein [Fuerstiella sp.]